MPDVEIRRAEPGDLDGLAACTAALWAEEDAGTRDPLRNQRWPAEHSAAWLAGLLTDTSALVLAAVADDAVAGHLVGASHPASSVTLGARAELVSLYVIPELRGDGVGSGLVAAFTEWGRELNAVRLMVTAYAANEGALRFYHRHGFAPLSVELAADL